MKRLMLIFEIWLVSTVFIASCAILYYGNVFPAKLLYSFRDYVSMYNIGIIFTIYSMILSHLIILFISSTFLSKEQLKIIDYISVIAILGALNVFYNADLEKEKATVENNIAEYNISPKSLLEYKIKKINDMNSVIKICKKYVDWENFFPCAFAKEIIALSQETPEDFYQKYPRMTGTSLFNYIPEEISNTYKFFKDPPSEKGSEVFNEEKVEYESNILRISELQAEIGEKDLFVYLILIMAITIRTAKTTAEIMGLYRKDKLFTFWK